jgi:polyribonucleotide 5'-hydroxyl-kinase
MRVCRAVSIERKFSLIWFPAETISDYSPSEEERVGQELYERVEPSMMMLHSLLAVMHAAVLDPLETIRDATVMGFVYVADVDEKKRQLKILAPLNTSFTDRPLVWGSWPERVVGLMGS